MKSFAAAVERRTITTFGLGLIAGLAIMGPALGPGALLNLDLAVVDDQAWPLGIFGLGSDISRAHPFDLFLIAAGRVLGTTLVVKTFYVVAVGVAAAGMSRLVPDRRDVIVIGASLLYACSPYLITRMAVGHLTMVAATALLPWTVTAFLSQHGRDRRSFVAGAVMGLTGIFGGLLTGLLVLAGLVSGHSTARRTGLALAGQVPWLAAGLVVMQRQPNVVGSVAFPSTAGRPLGPLRLIAGHGFWQDSFQIGSGNQFIPAVCGAVLLALALVGWRALVASEDHGWVRPAAVLGILIFVFIVADGLSPLRSAFDAATSNPIGAAFREPQRLLPLVLIWIIPAAAMGAGVLADRAAGSAARFLLPALPLLIALILGSPGLWGLGGQVHPVDLRDGWHQARNLIVENPGPTLVLPYSRYLALSFLENETKLVLNPVNRFLGGDVIQGSDIGLGGTSRETVDPRDAEIDAAIRRLRTGEDIGTDLAELGVRWIVLLHESRFDQYVELRGDPALEPVLSTDTVEVFSASAWSGPVTTGSGSVGVSRPIVIVAEIGSEGTDDSNEATEGIGGTWWTPAYAGWFDVSNFEVIEKNAAESGLIVQQGTTLVFLPGIALLAIHTLFLVGLGWATLTEVRRNGNH